MGPRMEVVVLNETQWLCAEAMIGWIELELQEKIAGAGTGGGMDANSCVWLNLSRCWLSTGYGGLILCRTIEMKKGCFSAAIERMIEWVLVNKLKLSREGEL